MSGKQEKKVRKQINNLIQDRMDNQKVQYTFAQLQTLVNLLVILTGKKPEKLELVEGYYTWYVQEANAQAEALGLKPGFKDDKVSFMGILLEKKVEIVVPEEVVPNNAVPKAS